jgi:hypothetical protein
LFSNLSDCLYSCSSSQSNMGNASSPRPTPAQQEVQDELYFSDDSEEEQEGIPQLPEPRFTFQWDENHLASILEPLIQADTYTPSERRSLLYLL